MKKTISIVLLITINTLFAKAQETGNMVNTNKYSGFYLGLGAGYGIATNKTNDFDNEKTTYNSTSTLYEYKSKPNSLGTGLSGGLYIGYLFRNHMAFEIGYSMFSGNSVEQKLEWHDNINDYHQINKHLLDGDMKRIIPAIKITTGEKFLHPYLKAGLIIGFGGKLTDNVSIDTYGSGSNSIKVDAKAVYTEGRSYGFNGSLGMDLMVEKKIGLFIEMNWNYQSWAPERGKLVAYSENGVDMLSRVAGKNVTYNDSYSYNTSTGSSYNGLRQGPKFYTPLSSFGGMIGFRFLINSFNMGMTKK